MCRVLSSLAELEQLRCELSMKNFSTLMESSPRAIKRAFELSHTKVCSEFLQDLFVPSFSPKGSDKRAQEEALIMSWISYLQYLEGMIHLYIICKHGHM